MGTTLDIATSTLEISSTITTIQANESTCWWNDTSRDDSTPFLYTPAEANVGGSFALLLSLAGFTFNLIVIAAIMNHRKTREQQMTPFIISLCSSDLIFSVATLPFYAIRFFAGYVYIHHII